MSNALYDADFYEWTVEQTDLLRAGRFSELDLENLAEEVRSIGQSQKSELRRRLSRLLQHLLKWRYQPDLRSRSWTSTILEQRTQIEDLLEDSPSLRSHRAFDLLPRAYTRARTWALSETGLLTLPETCEWTVEQIVGPAFLP